MILGKLQGQLRPAIDRYEVLEVEKQDIFKSTLASFNHVCMPILHRYADYLTRIFLRFSIYSKFLYTMLPKGHGGEKINIDDKVLLEYYKLEKDFEGPMESLKAQKADIHLSPVIPVIESLRKTR